MPLIGWLADILASDWLTGSGAYPKRQVRELIPSQVVFTLTVIHTIIMRPGNCVQRTESKELSPEN